ncbi:MAG: hypothetical protein EBZ49_00325 [Proteobacteria bacterium]|nr:hypothetical protein [Pseudomonadota bacterium]
MRIRPRRKPNEPLRKCVTVYIHGTLRDDFYDYCGSNQVNKSELIEKLVFNYLKEVGYQRSAFRKSMVQGLRKKDDINYKLDLPQNEKSTQIL